MEDEHIIQLYWQRSEDAIAETALKYGAYCNQIAYSILRNPEDAEECVTDTYLHTWNTIPPQRPRYFAAFLGKIVRNISISRYRKNTALFRGGGQTRLVFEELEESVPSKNSIEQESESSEIIRVLEGFIRDLTTEKKQVFLLRYWYFRSMDEIAVQLNFSVSKVRSMLFRMRKELKQHLEREGILL